MRAPAKDRETGRARTALLLAALSFAPLGAQAQAADTFAPFHHDPARPEVLRLDGEIDVRTPFMLGAALRAQPQITTLELHSPGGDVYQALSMVDRIRTAGLATRIAPGDRCHSACSFLFFAGVDRKAEGALGVHQLAAPNQQSAQYVMNDVLDVLLALDVPDDVRRRMFQTPAEEMYVFSPAEVAALGFDAAPGTTSATSTAITTAALPTDPVGPVLAVAPDPDPAPPPVFTVKADGSGDYVSIAEAVRAAEDGTRIRVYPGTYTGHVTVKASVDIVGTGPRDQIIWETTWPSILRWEAAGGSLTGLTLRPATSGPLTHRDSGLIEIRGGAPAIRGCDIAALPEATAAIRVTGAGSNPRIEDNRVTGGRIGIQFDGGEGDVQGNTISRSEIGIAVLRGAPRVRSNQIRNVDVGIGLGRAARGAVAGNEVHYCARGIVARKTPATEIGDNAVDACETPRARE